MGTVTDVGPGVRTPAPGDMVLALGSGHSGSSVLVDAALTAPKPHSLTAAQAVTLLHTYVPALHGLRDLARARAGETILIHPATGATGAAATHVARLLDATPVALRPDADEERVLLDWAGIGEPGERVDVVFTETSAPVPSGARYVQLGGRPPSTWPANTTYHRVDIAALPSRQLSGLLHDVLTLVHQGDLHPLPFTQTAARVEVGIDRREPACVVTGGLGDLGVVVADLLVDRGARHLVLVGRSPEPPHRTATLNRWRDRGVDVEYHPLDVADESALRPLLNRPIRGVVHAAGIGTHTPLTELSAQEIRTVLHPKLRGAEALDRVLADRPLDFFVLFSSAAAVLPSPLLGAYAAANAWLDALASHRCARGLPTLSIGWGFWETGMAVRLNGPGELRVPSGLASFTPARGAALLGELLDQGVTGHVIATPADWDAYAAAYTGRATHKLLAELASPSSFAPNVHIPRARTAPPSETSVPGPSDGVDQVSRLVAEVLRLTPDGLDRRRPLNKLGMDSLMAAEIRTRVRDTYGVDIPMLNLLKGASVHDVAAAVARAQDVRIPRARTAPTGNTPVSKPVSKPVSDAPHDVDHLSQLVADVLRLTPDNLDHRRPLNKLGMDSLMAAEIRTRVRDTYGVDIPMLNLLKGA